LLSGSGSVVYGIFDDPGRLEEASGALREDFANWKLLPSRAVEQGAHVVRGNDGTRV
jgi:hypothetical protein